MTRAQNMIVNYINQQFVPGSVTIIPVGESHVKITDKNKESLTFTVNIFGDIIDADTNKIIAEAKAAHTLSVPFRNQRNGLIKLETITGIKEAEYEGDTRMQNRG